MNILFINDAYWPEPNAITFCIDNIIRYCSKDDNIYVLCLKNRRDEADFERYNNITVRRVYVPYYIICENLRKMKTTNRIVDFCRKVLFEIISCQKINYAESYRNSVYSKHTIYAASNMIEQNKIDHIVTASSPFSAHRLGAKLKKMFPKIKWTAYQLDPFSNNLYLRCTKKKKREKIEISTLNTANNIVMLSCVYDMDLNDGLIEELNQKVISVTCPGLLIDRSDTGSFEIVEKTTPVLGVYLGNVYDQTLIDVLSNISKMSEGSVTFRLYGAGTDGIKNTGVTGHGFISNAERETVLSDADFLVLQGDRAPNQVPSKIINYIKTGKPILHIYSINDDSCTVYLRAYRNSLSIPFSTEISGDDFKKLMLFCEMARDHILTADQISERMNSFLDKNVSGKIYNLI